MREVIRMVRAESIAEGVLERRVWRVMVKQEQGSDNGSSLRDRQHNKSIERWYYGQ